MTQDLEFKLVFEVKTNEYSTTITSGNMTMMMTISAMATTLNTSRTTKTTELKEKTATWEGVAMSMVTTTISTASTAAAAATITTTAMEIVTMMMELTMTPVKPAAVVEATVPSRNHRLLHLVPLDH